MEPTNISAARDSRQAHFSVQETFLTDAQWTQSCCSQIFHPHAESICNAHNASSTVKFQLYNCCWDILCPHGGHKEINWNPPPHHNFDEPPVFFFEVRADKVEFSPTLLTGFLILQSNDPPLSLIWSHTVVFVHVCPNYEADRCTEPWLSVCPPSALDGEVHSSSITNWWFLLKFGKESYTLHLNRKLSTQTHNWTQNHLRCTKTDRGNRQEFGWTTGGKHLAVLRETLCESCQVSGHPQWMHLVWFLRCARFFQIENRGVEIVFQHKLLKSFKTLPALSIKITKTSVLSLRLQQMSFSPTKLTSRCSGCQSIWFTSAPFGICRVAQRTVRRDPEPRSCFERCSANVCVYTVTSLMYIMF